MPLPPFAREKCLKCIDELLKFTIAKMFAQPVDPVREGVPNYFEIVTHPMDLGTIKEKLMKDTYQTVAEWRDDVELVWSNSLKVSPPNSVLGVITVEMQSNFQRMSRFISDDPVLDWSAELASMRDEFNEITKKVKSPKEQSLSRSNSTTFKSSKPKESSHGSNIPAIHKKRIRDQSQKIDVQKLSADIRKINNYVHIQTLYEIIKKHETNFLEEDDRIEFDLSSAKPNTLSSLRDKVDQFLGIQ